MVHKNYQNHIRGAEKWHMRIIVLYIHLTYSNAWLGLRLPEATPYSGEDVYTQ